MSYTDLSDDDKINLAIRFVAQSQPMPPLLEDWLRGKGLYDLIVKPGITNG